MKYIWSQRGLFLRILFIGVMLNLVVVPAWSGGTVQSNSVTRALDRQEVAGTVSQAAAEPSVKEAYIGQQAQYFVAPQTASKHSFEIGYDIYNYKYQETDVGTFFMKNKGTYAGPTLDYAYHFGNGSGEFVDELRLQGRFAWGDVDYSNKLAQTFNGLDDYMYEVRGLVAKSYNLHGVATATPYAGIGYRYLNDGLEKFQPGGYNREANYYYIPLGSDLRMKIRGGWDLAMNLEYDYLLVGKQKSHLEDIGDGRDTLVNDQKQGYGLRGSVKASKDITKKVNVFVEPFIRFWDIEKSDVKFQTSGGAPICAGGLCLAGYEPSNVTKEVGLKMGVGF